MKGRQQPPRGGQQPMAPCWTPAWSPPLCGQTLCDSLKVIASTTGCSSASPRRCDTAWSTSTTTAGEPHGEPTADRLPAPAAGRAFKHYNISWELEVLEVSNSLPAPPPHPWPTATSGRSAAKDTDPRCNHTLTGHDGGDCRHLHHHLVRRSSRTGWCDMDCNYERFNFDGGECCDPNITDVTKTCFRPDNLHR